MSPSTCPCCGKASIPWRRRMSVSYARSLTCSECGETLGYPVWKIILNCVLLIAFFLIQILTLLLGFGALWGFTFVVLFSVVIVFTLWVPLVPVRQAELSNRLRWILVIALGSITLGILLLFLNYR